MISTASELAKSVGGRYIDSIINVGCINPTKVAGTRLSLYSIDLEMAKDTYGPTITSKKPKLTLNNDAVFARLVESQWKDLGEIRANYACKQADPNPTGGQAPLSAAVCNTLAALWSDADKKINDCIVKTFKPITGLALGICELARDTYVNCLRSGVAGCGRRGPTPTTASANFAIASRCSSMSGTRGSWLRSRSTATAEKRGPAHPEEAAAAQRK